MAKRAVFAVKDSTGVAALGGRLANDFGFEILANPIAAEALRSKGVACCEIADAEASGLVADKEHGVRVLVANFVDVETAGRAFLSWKVALQAFDRPIVEAIRYGAWAVDRIAVLGNPTDFDAAVEELESRGGTFGQAFRMQRATAALRACSEFDFAVAEYLEIQGADAPDMGALSGYAKAIRFAWNRAQLMDTGENRHQRAALYGGFWECFEQMAGPKLDYLAALTVSRATYLIGEFEKPTAALLRKGRIVTVVCGETMTDALRSVFRHEAISGSWLVVNGTLGFDDLDTALKNGVVGLLAPDFGEAERERLAGIEEVRALVSRSGLGYEELREVRSVVGGALVQDKDRVAVNPMEWTVQGLAQPLVEDWEALVFAAKVARHAESSALAVASGERLIALEAGHYSAERAWQAVFETGTGLANTVAVFDEPEVDSETLTRMKKQGVRVALLPSGAEVDRQREAANACGLVLLTMGKSMRRV